MQNRTLGRYQLLRELGRGAMGVVYLAHDPEIDRQVAIKTVRFFETVPAREGEEARQRFIREARAAGRLLHPGIVTVFDVGEADDNMYLAMEFIEGQTLDSFCDPDNLLPIETVAEMVAGIAESLHFAHEADIVHRDVKPANLMRVGDTACKIMDFGLAKPSNAQLTQDGALLGTPSYMSPEQIRGENADRRSDLFSLSVVLFELATGQRPFGGDSISSIIYRIVHEEPRDATALAGRVPQSLNAFLQRALAKEPATRFENGLEYAAALRRTVREQTAATVRLEREDPETETSLPPKVATVPRSSPTPYVLTALLLVIGSAAAAYYFREEIGIAHFFEPKEIWWETQVRTEPPGLEVKMDGIPLSADLAGLVRFKPEGPFGVLTAGLECRTTEHPITAVDAGGEVVLVVEPTELDWRLDAGTAAAVRLNGKKVGTAPVDLKLKLCDENHLQLSAAGFRPLSLDIPAGASALQARTLLSGLTLTSIPNGVMNFPKSSLSLVYYVDGKRVDPKSGRLELTEGEHELRIKNAGYWIDRRRKFRVTADQTVTPDLKPPPLTTLTVQAFPANCKVFLRRPGGEWKFFDDTPVRKKIAVGRYQVRVKLNPTGETRDRDVELVAGDNPPIRVAFGRTP